MNSATGCVQRYSQGQHFSHCDLREPQKNKQLQKVLFPFYNFFLYVYLTWDPVILSPEADLRPSMHTHNRDIEKSSGQATQFNIWTIWAVDRTSAQPQVKLILLRSNALKFQPPVTYKTKRFCNLHLLTSLSFYIHWMGWAESSTIYCIIYIHVKFEIKVTHQIIYKLYILTQIKELVIKIWPWHQVEIMLKEAHTFLYCRLIECLHTLLSSAWKERLGERKGRCCGLDPSRETAKKRGPLPI